MVVGTRSVVLALAFCLVLTSLTLAAANWSQLHPSASPPARGYPAMAYDPVSQKIVLFGGYNGSYLNDTWTFDGTTWTEQHPTSAPPVRTAAGMAFDRVTRKLVLYGGFSGNGNYLGDTWLWDGAASTWTQANPAHSPATVTGPSVFTDPKNGRVDEYGGFDGTTHRYQLTTWQWTGSDWKQLHTTNSPLARAFAIAATNPEGKYVALYAGLGDIRTDNSWTFDGVDWTQQSPHIQPANRYGASGAFDPALKSVIAFGGGEGGPDVNDTWAFLGKQWKQLTPKTAPPAREGFGMVLDLSLGHIVIFGGQAGSGVLNDTWELQP